MKTGLSLSILGALLVAIGLGLLNPVFLSLFDGKVVPMFELEVAEKFVYGYDLPILQTIMVFLGLVGLASVAGYFIRAKRRIASTSLLFALAIFSVMAYVGGDAQKAIETAIAPAKLFQGEAVIPLEGQLFVYGGAVLIFLASLVVFASRPVYKAKDRLLRVAMLWNGSVVREEVLAEPRNVTVGEDLRATFVLPASVTGGLSRKFPLFRKDRRGRYELALLSNMGGQIQLQNQASSIQDYLAKHGKGDAAHYVPIEAGDWGVLNFADKSLFFQFIRPEDRVKRHRLAALPWDILGTTMLSGIVQLAFILTTVFLWEEHATRDPKRDQRKDIKVEVQTKQNLEEELLDEAEEEDTTGKKAEGEEGKFGDPDMEPEIESKVPKRDGEMVAKIDPKKVGLNDLLSSSKLGGKSDISNILSRNTSGFSNKLAVAMSGTGSEFVMGHGSGGLGFQGTGTGGGGTGGYGRIHGLGRIDTGGGVGVRATMGRKGAKKVAALKLGQGDSQGFCSRGDIQKNVRMRAGAIRACYEQQLQIHPKLAGKVTIRWTIDLTGGVKVANVVESSMSNSAVEQCILRAIRRIRFQKPEGGICIVNWPFVFSPG